MIRRDVVVQATGAVGVLRRLVPEDDLTREEHEAIRQLLVIAFPENAEAFSRVSYLGARPEYRLWLEGQSGEIFAHLDFERRAISVGGEEKTVAGVGEVAVRPKLQGRGLGRLLMRELEQVLRQEVPSPFGLLYCLDEVADFYERVGWRRLYQPSVSYDPVTGERYEEVENTFLLPALASPECWPQEGVIDILGEGW